MNTPRNKYRSKKNRTPLTITLWPEQLQWIQKTAANQDKTDTDVIKECIARLTKISNYADPQRIFDRLPDRSSETFEFATNTTIRINEDQLAELDRIITEYKFKNRSFAIRVGIEAMMKQPIKI